MTENAKYWPLSGTEVVYKGMGCIEASRVAHTDYFYFEAISESNMLMKFARNLKRIMEPNKKLYDLKCIILAFKLYRGGI